jgi:hypothetical protein
VPLTGRAIYQVDALTGWQWFDESAALDAAPLIGVRIGMPVFGQAVSLGALAAFSRVLTRGSYFPYNRQIYFSDATHRNDTTLIFEVSQRVTLGTYGADARVRFGAPGAAGDGLLGRLQFDLGGGVGGYTIWLDPEQERFNRSFSGLMFSVGAGIGANLWRDASVELRIDDMIFTDFDREQLSLSDPRLSDDLFPNPVPPPPAAKSTIHNPRLSVAFRFTPGAR